MSLRSGTLHFVALLCLWTTILMAAGSIVAAEYCESPNPPRQGSPGGCPPASG
ncbi:hypothetical protein ACP70R_029829 [Stipagrostis hirtigluma subsp. patula]